MRRLPCSAPIHLFSVASMLGGFPIHLPSTASMLGGFHSQQLPYSAVLYGFHILLRSVASMLIWAQQHHTR
ncbi:hypothetical protein AMTR_s00031p00174330 [Amborella trichopoda]|uniref:Uncharacterized protein n=1 Tax=Amborella trichopoda TaxID=13333 RepID=U5CTI7_AMBTC|nr:hypothetical protein AMTR_s00031p00174330 [Amborella trichopoda]